jgi:hypothetical protein
LQICLRIISGDSISIPIFDFWKSASNRHVK